MEKEKKDQKEQKVFKYIVLDTLSEDNNYFLVKVEENDDYNISHAEINAYGIKDIIELKTELVLYPGCILVFNSEILELNYTLNPLQLHSLPETAKKLNSDNISGKVVFYDKSDYRLEIKLDEKISVKNKTYSSLKYINDNFDEDVLVGMEVSGIVFDRYSFFGNNKVLLPNEDKKLKDILVKQDLSLIKRSKFLVNTAKVLFVAIIIIGTILSLGSIIVALNIDYIKPDPVLFVVSFFLIAFLSFAITTMLKDYHIKYKKDDLKSPFKLFNIAAYIIVLLVISFLFKSYVSLYKYDSSYVYDNEKNEFIEDSSFRINSLKDMDIAKIKQRYNPVYDKYRSSFYLKTKKQKEFIMIDFDIKLKFDKELLLSFPEIVSEIEKDFQIKLNELDYQNLSIDSKDINSAKIFVSIKEMFIKDLEEKGVLLDQIDSIETTTRLSELE